MKNTAKPNAVPAGSKGRSVSARRGTVKTRSRSPGSKYRNHKTTVDGITFDSKKEAARYGELKLLERAGEISNLELQPEFELVPPQPGLRAVKYRADFKYTLKGGGKVVEDVKGKRTTEYMIKKKLMAYFHKIEIFET